MNIVLCKKLSKCALQVTGTEVYNLIVRKVVNAYEMVFAVAHFWS